MATLVISQYTCNPAQQLSTDDELEVRGFYTRDFIGSDAVTPVFGNNSNGAFGPYYSITPTLSVSGELIVPAHTVQPTTESNPTGLYIEQLWVNGAYVQTLIPNDSGGTGWQIPTVYGDPIAYDEIATYNRARRLLYAPETYLTADQVIQEILRLSGNFDYMAVGVNGIGRASFPPVLASAPIVLMANDPRVGDWFNIEAYSASTAATAAQNAVFIAAAVTAAASAGGGIYIPLGTFATNSVTISVPVMFADGTSQLAPATAQVVTYTKAIQADPSYHMAGAGTHVFTGNTVQKDFWVAWWGADAAAAGAATSTALNAAFVAWPSGTTMHLSPRKNYVYTSLAILNKFNSTLLGNDSQDGYTDTSNAPRFTFSGTNGGTGITLTDCYACTFKGFGALGAATLGATGAAKNILVTQVGGSDPPISSQNVFQSLFVQANNTRSDYVGIDVDNVSATNNEFHQFLDCKFVGGQQAFPSQSGIGIRLGHGNVKQAKIERNSFLYLEYGICGVGNPSFRSSMNSFSGCNIQYGGTFGDAILIGGDDSEGCTQVWAVSDMTADTPVTIIGGRYEDLRGGQAASGTTSTASVISVRSTKLTVLGNRFVSVTAAFDANFIEDAGGGNSRLFWRNNTVTGLSAADFVTGRNTFQAYDEDFTASLAASAGITSSGTAGVGYATGAGGRTNPSN